MEIYFLKYFWSTGIGSRRRIVLITSAEQVKVMGEDENIKELFKVIFHNGPIDWGAAGVSSKENYKLFSKKKNGNEITFACI